MTTPTVRTAQTGAVLRITWNRPDALNALTGEMLAHAATAIEHEAQDRAARVIVLAGAGRAFSSGADLHQVNPDQSPDTETVEAANRLIRAIRTVPVPVVAAVRGAAAGVGCSIALAADLTVAAESAYFLLAFTGVGLMPDGGATAFVPASIGRARATRMAMLAERIDAGTAEDWGLISAAVPDDRFDEKVDALVERLSSGPTAAYAQIKRALDATSLGGLESALEAERAGQLALFGTRDFAEGAAAFLGKRAPRFVGE
ncbi:enoyl-CoA hydratase-related protein [Actinophytocola oryzae]|uniref:Enoyl-CoA hydratase n=1 Tax=Actinophytocola oryzae TaxID=502181 RepID=A0A4R7UTQ8_9PSEU|nr:enoyl-CoA hydratase-related protein [Actinophytocola oryzae]TDV37771.1 enoyl-CoA hydratase [Actinophytocola oryzae]